MQVESCRSDFFPSHVVALAAEVSRLVFARWWMWSLSFDNAHGQTQSATTKDNSYISQRCDSLQI